MTERSALGGGAGYSLIELTCAMALAATLVGISIPATRDALDEIRAAAAARDMAARIGLARLEAARRSSAFAYRFVPAGADYRFTPHADGNDNGVRTIEIADGTDLTLAAAERLADKHSGISFGLLAGLPDLDGSRASEEGVQYRFGAHPDAVARWYSHARDALCAWQSQPVRGPGTWCHRPHAGIPLRHGSRALGSEVRQVRGASTRKCRLIRGERLTRASLPTEPAGSIERFR